MPRKTLSIIIAVLAVGVVGSSVAYSIGSGIIYLGPSIPSFNVTGNGTTDVGIPIHLSISLDKAPASKLSYLWYANGKASYSSDFTTEYSSPGNYTISLKVSMSSNHTSVSREIKEIVNPQPTITISENKNTIDAGQEISFTSKVTGGTGPYQYSWPFPFSSTSANPTLKLYSDIGGITATVVDSVGGSGESNTLYPNISTDPFVIANSNTTYTDVNAPVTFSASPSYGVSPYSYQWSWDGSVISTSKSFSYSFSQSGSQTVNLQMKDSLGFAATSYTTVYVNNDPTVTLSGTSNIQTGYEAMIVANTNHGSGTFNYQWYLNGVSVTSDASYNALFYTFNSSGSYSVNVIATDQAGVSASDTVTFYVS